MYRNYLIKAREMSLTSDKLHPSIKDIVYNRGINAFPVLSELLQQGSVYN